MPVDSGIASWKHDKTVFYLLLKAVDELNARSWLNKDGSGQNKDGRTGMFSLVELYESNYEHEAKLRALSAKLNPQKYSGYGMNNAKKLASRLYETFEQFSLMDEAKSEREKLRLFRNMLHPQGQMAHAFFVESLKRDIDQVLLEARNGNPVNYSLFTSRLTSGKAEWLKDNEKAVKVSSATTAASTTDTSEANTAKAINHGYNRETGEPTKRWIQGVDVSIVYQQTHKVDEDDFKRLPAIVKTYFKNNQDKKCLPKIQSMTKPKSRQQKKKSTKT